MAAVMSAVISLMGFAGSITMSAIKRDRGVKDYGTLVEGHGGVLDRIDSLCFAAPVFFHCTCWWLHAPLRSVVRQPTIDRFSVAFSRSRLPGGTSWGTHCTKSRPADGTYYAAVTQSGWIAILEKLTLRAGTNGAILCQLSSFV